MRVAGDIVVCPRKTCSAVSLSHAYPRLDLTKRIMVIAACPYRLLLLFFFWHSNIIRSPYLVLSFSWHVLGMFSTFLKPFTFICIKASALLTLVRNLVAVARCLLLPGGHRFPFCFRHSGPIAVLATSTMGVRGSIFLGTVVLMGFLLSKKTDAPKDESSRF